LANIAISSAMTAKDFGIDAKIAMLSYSTGNSSSSNEVQKVKDAVELIKKLEPSLNVVGPIQYDAAINKTIAMKKLSNSTIMGDATILIFPDLNTGNNTYKAVQNSGNTIAIGPVLQGLNGAINDLSRGATVADIVNTVALTAIQAQGLR
jgi:phosphate acetyltransferase